MHYHITRGQKRYEKSNHLGNVLVTISDIKIPHDYNTDYVVDYYTADIISAQDYYPFGSIMPGRNWSNEEYRFGFNGMERDDEAKGTGNSYDFGARMYDSRLGKWLSLDPLMASFPFISPYNFVANNPIFFIDADGEILTIKDPSLKEPIIFKPGDPIPEGASEFVVKTINALNTIYTSVQYDEVAKAKIDLLINSEVNVDISETKEFLDTKYRPIGDMGGEVFFNPYEVLETIGGKMSPTVGLAHELDHAWLQTSIQDQLAKANKAGDKELAKKLRNQLLDLQSASTGSPIKAQEEQRATDGLEFDVSEALGQYGRLIYDEKILNVYKTDNVSGTKKSNNVDAETQKKIDKTNEDIQKAYKEDEN